MKETDRCEALKPTSCPAVCVWVVVLMVLLWGRCTSVWVYRLRHGTRGVPLCAACQTWLTCSHLSPEPPPRAQWSGWAGADGGWSFSCSPHLLSFSLSPTLFLSLHRVVSDPPPSCPSVIVGFYYLPPGHSSLWFRRYLTRCFRMSAAAARQIGPCECVGAEHTQERRHGNNEVDCWFPPSPSSPLCCLQQ